MDFDINNWVNDLTVKLKETFAENLLFVGLQGSYKRGESTPNSDIDIVVILDKLTMNDLKKYKNIINSMPEKEKACGFISGKKEIQNWPKIDIFQFKNDTEPFFGFLDELVPIVEKQDIETYIKNSCANLYHMAVHSYLYDKNIDNLKMLLKSLFFIFPAIYYLRTGVYIPTKKELLSLLEKEEKSLFEPNTNKLSENELDKIYEKIITFSSQKFSS